MSAPPTNLAVVALPSCLLQAVFETGAGVSKGFTGSGIDEDGGGEMSALLAMDKDKIEALLRFGAYAIMDEDESNAAATAFQNSTIDQVRALAAPQIFADICCCFLR